MAKKLKIYACSGIGETAKSGYNYWLDNTNPVYNTQAVNMLNTTVNLLVTELEHLPLSETGKLDRLNDIDLYTLCMYYAQSYAGNKTELEAAGRAIGRLAATGDFEFGSLDNTKRDAHLDELFERTASIIKNGEDNIYNPEFEAWWKANIIDFDKVGLTPEQQAVKIGVNGIGAAEDALNDPNIGEKLRNAGDYFLYTYFTDEQLKKMPFVFTKKKQMQTYHYNISKKTFTEIYGTEAAMKNLIRAKITEQFGAEPEQVCLDIVNRGARPVNGIGVAGTAMVGALTVAEFITVLTTVLTFIGGLIVAILQYCAKVQEAKYASIDKASVDGGTPNENDYKDFIWKQTLNKIKNSPITWILLGLGLLFTIKDK